MNSPEPAPTSREVGKVRTPLVVVALGSWEQHGPHLPLDTDTRIAAELAGRLVSEIPDCVLGPTLAVSSSGEHSGFPGTLSVGSEVVVDILVELVRSADWASGVIVINGHGGNAECLGRARDLLVSEGRKFLPWSPPLVDPTDSHAGYVETSLMLAIDSSAVRSDEIASGPNLRLQDILAELRDGGVASVSPSGVLGDPMRAEPSLGHRLLADWTDLLVADVRSWRNTIRDAPN